MIVPQLLPEEAPGPIHVDVDVLVLVDVDGFSNQENQTTPAFPRDPVFTGLRACRLGQRL